jgi:hypothetical protein
MNTAQKIAAHTPGPWEVNTNILTPRIFSGDVMIADVRHVRGNQPNGSAEANARLIAAAPALLEALKRAQWELNDIAQHGGRGGDESMKMISDALAKVQE